jgi:hypothetical protein
LPGDTDAYRQSMTPLDVLEQLELRMELTAQELEDLGQDHVITCSHNISFLQATWMQKRFNTRNSVAVYA